MSEQKDKKTDWSAIDEIHKRHVKPPQVSDKSVSMPKARLPLPVPAPLKNENDQEPQGVLAKFHEGRLSRKASVQALKVRYDKQIEALTHQLSQACTVEKAKADVLADEFLRELDAQHLKVLGELGLKNTETRIAALAKLNQVIVDRVSEIQGKDWPESMIAETIDSIFELQRRGRDEILNELGSD